MVETLVKAAKTSAAWYERFPEHMKLAPLDFGYSYITRSGRIDDSQLRAMSPLFMERYDAHSSILKIAIVRNTPMINRIGHAIVDHVPNDAAGAQEIGFNIPERYNASEILFGNLQAGRADKVAIYAWKATPAMANYASKPQGLETRLNRWDLLRATVSFSF